MYFSVVWTDADTKLGQIVRTNLILTQSYSTLLLKYILVLVNITITTTTTAVAATTVLLLL